VEPPNELDFDAGKIGIVRARWGHGGEARPIARLSAEGSD